MNWRELLGMPFEEYKSTKPGMDMFPYGDLLLLREWRDKRIEVFLKDGWKCAKCGKDLSILSPNYNATFYIFHQDSAHPPFEAHHTYYVKNKLPWEYPDEALMTVCHTCHTEIHETTIINIYPNDLKLEEGTKMAPCTKCDGRKIFPEYRHVEGGVCFRCRGTGFQFYFKIKESD